MRHGQPPDLFAGRRAQLRRNLPTTAEIRRGRATDGLLPVLGRQRTPGRGTGTGDPVRGIQVPAYDRTAGRRRPQSVARRLPHEPGLITDITCVQVLELTDLEVAEPFATGCGP